MSLSFPGLIAAVPLHAVDFSLENNQYAPTAQRGSASSTPRPRRSRRPVMPRLDFQRNWFSDGGICANLPLHFFDSALPRRPTFAIDLAAFPHGQESARRARQQLPADAQLRRPAAPAERLERAGHRRAGDVLLLDHRHRAHLGRRGPAVDAGLPRPDRHRLHRPRGGRDEPQHEAGGAPPQRARSGRGPAARRGFAGDHPGVAPAEGWDNHRWLRFRTATAAFSETLGSFRNGFETEPPGTTPYDVWVGDGADGPLPSYPLEGAPRRPSTGVRTGCSPPPPSGRGPGRRVHPGRARAAADDAAGALRPGRGDRSAHVSSSTSVEARWPARTAPSM